MLHRVELDIKEIVMVTSRPVAEDPVVQCAAETFAQTHGVIVRVCYPGDLVRDDSGK